MSVYKKEGICPKRLDLIDCLRHSCKQTIKEQTNNCQYRQSLNIAARLSQKEYLRRVENAKSHVTNQLMFDTYGQRSLSRAISSEALTSNTSNQLHGLCTYNWKIWNLCNTHMLFKFEHGDFIGENRNFIDVPFFFATHTCHLSSRTLPRGIGWKSEN